MSIHTLTASSSLCKDSSITSHSLEILDILFPAIILSLATVAMMNCLVTMTTHLTMNN